LTHSWIIFSSPPLRVDVQWMTAGAGILHEEFHSEAFTRSGGELKMIQLWVNLPAKDKMATPGYQSITAGTIPTVALTNGREVAPLIQLHIPHVKR
jgi:redox-sensitive bicupin YhaK (pirin superfamily)